MATELDTERGIVPALRGSWTVDPLHSPVEFRVEHPMISSVRDLVADIAAVRTSLDAEGAPG